MNREKKFTLIELLVIVAIIGILASLLLPALKNGKEVAKRIKCTGQLRQIYLCGMAYGDQNQDVVPPEFLWGRTDIYWGSYYTVWEHLLREAGNLKNDSIFACPNYYKTNVSVYFWASYGMKSEMIDIRLPPVIAKRFSSVKYPSRRCFTQDHSCYRRIYQSYWGWNWSSLDLEKEHYIPGIGNRNSVLKAKALTGTIVNTDVAFQDFLYGRHLNTVNTLFYDGHVQSMISEEAAKHFYFTSPTSPDNMYNSFQ
ncbi:MAG: hypothetical protein A2X49_10460 [Lentisphaerae bacterium GWF2_52_8]|nr:MAG: hypothetical protein A2X49_10460 [Lentisphaerae bacterium GWF2_52_8]